VLHIIAEIITSGRELLIGRTLNTNGTWIAQQLTSIGVTVARITSVGDTVFDISRTVRESLERAPSIIITTGGLGSTYDDITLEGVASGLGLPMILNKDALSQVRKRYDLLEMEITLQRQKMAFMPLGARPLVNISGSAPGMYLIVRGVMLFCLPGVPKEMMEMFSGEVMDIIKSKAPPGTFVERSFTIDGIPESTLAPIIEEWIHSHPDVYLKSHPSGGEGLPIITIHISATGNDPHVLEQTLLDAERSFSKELIKLKKDEGMMFH
jgi:molybdenum cofactor synthesis domain-containing protein